MSVLVTSYMHERYIARALDGVLAQNDAVAWELIVGDDGSTDASPAIISEYVSRYPERVQAFLPERNLGQEGAVLFSELLRRARGEFIVGLDGDDHWTSPVKLQRQVEHLDANPGCSLCFHNVLWVHEDGSRPPTPYNSSEQPPRIGLYELIAENPVASCSAVFRRSAIDPLPESFFVQPWGDWLLNVAAARRGSVDYLAEVMAVHLTHPAGMWSRVSWSQALRGITDCQEAMRTMIPADLEPRRRQALGQTWFRRATEHTRLREREEARRCLRESMSIWPVRPSLRRGTGDRRRVALWLRLNVLEGAAGRLFARGS